jgi:hypothetical protein
MIQFSKNMALLGAAIAFAGMPGCERESEL